MPEEQAFGLLVKIMSDYGMRDLFRNEFDMLHLQFFQLERMIEVWLRHLKQAFAYLLESDLAFVWQILEFLLITKQ